MSFVKVLLSVPDSIQTMTQTLNMNTGLTQVSITALDNLIQAMLSGEQLAFSKISTGALQATGTVTFSSLVADDTVTVNGVVFTAKVSPSGAQEFALGADDTAAAANFAAKINASALAHIVSVVTATSALGVITLTAVQPGLAGNQNTLAISAHGSVSAARMAGGSDGNEVSTAFGVAS